MPTTKEKLEAYLNKTYAGRKWRRLSKEELDQLSDAELIERANELDAIEPYQPNEVKPDEQRELWGPNGDIPDDVTDEQMDSFIDNERQRIYSIISSPPRSEKYIDIFKRKYPNIDEKIMREGFIMSSDQWADRQARRDGSNVKAKKIDGMEISKRVAEGKVEEVAPIGFADRSAIAAIHSAIYAGSDGVDRSAIVIKSPDGSIIKMKPLLVESEVCPDDHYEPIHDTVKPIVIPFDGEEIPSDEEYGEAFKGQEEAFTKMIEHQREALKSAELERGIPPKAEKELV